MILLLYGATVALNQFVQGLKPLINTRSSPRQRAAGNSLRACKGISRKGWIWDATGKVGAGLTYMMILLYAIVAVERKMRRKSSTSTSGIAVSQFQQDYLPFKKKLVGWVMVVMSCKIT